MPDELQDGVLPSEESEDENQIPGDLASTDEDAPKEEPQLTPDQEKASRGGWTDKEAWVADGKDEDDWINAKQFNRNGQIIDDIKKNQQTIKEMREEREGFDKRLENQRLILEAGHKRTITDLKSKRKSAIEEGDVEGTEQIQDQIDELSSQNLAPEPKPKEAAKDLESNGFTKDENEFIDEYNKDNPWIHEDTPKASWARKQFYQAVNKGVSVTEAIQFADKDSAEQFPPTNPKRSQSATVEGGRSVPGGAPKTSPLQWSELTTEEAGIYKQIGHEFGSKDEFLQSVKDSRAS